MGRCDGSEARQSRDPCSPQGTVQGASGDAFGGGSDTDKTGHESTVPVSPAVRAAIDRVLEQRPGVGRGLLSPSLLDPSKPVRYELTCAWLATAERLAGVPKLEGGVWHPYRRKWATERKHLPDVAAAGGWKGTQTLMEVYQMPDQDTMLQVVLGAGELRESRP